MNLVGIYSLNFLFLLHLLFIITGLQAERSDSLKRHYSLYMPDMTINTGLIHAECPKGIVSDISFHSDFAYAGKTTCSININIWIPVEWTTQLQQFLDFSITAQNLYAGCISNQTCNNIDMSEWRSMAVKHYQICRYCDFQHEEEKAWRCSYPNQTAVMEPEKLREIIQTMYLYVNFTCTIEGQQFTTLNVTNTADNAGDIIVNSHDFNCTADEDINVINVLEQVSPTRFRMSNESVLPELLRVDSNSSTSILNFTQWSVYGGYYWGQNKTRMTIPSSVDILYNCEAKIKQRPETTRMSSVTMMSVTMTTNSKPTLQQDVSQIEPQKTTAVDETFLLVLALSVAGILTIAVSILSIILILKTIRKRRQSVTLDSSTLDKI